MEIKTLRTSKKTVTEIKNIKILKNVYQGYGLAYYNDEVLFVNSAIAGDVLNVKTEYKKAKSLFCSITDIVEPSPLRGAIRCTLSDTCGACDWVNIPYENQIVIKNTILKELFHPLKSIIDLPEIIKSPIIDYYRNKSFLPIQKINDKILVGMYEKQTHNVVEHKKCFLHPEIFNKIISHIKAWISEANVSIYNEKSKQGLLRHIGFRCNTDLSSIIIVIVTKSKKLPFTKQLVNKLLQNFPNIAGIVQNIQEQPNNVITGENEIVLYGNKFYYQKLNDLIFKIDYKAFFQVNTFQAQIIYGHIKDEIEDNYNVLDAYSGTGSIGLSVAKKAKMVTFIESNTDAHLSAIENACLNSIKNTRFINNETHTVIEDITRENNFDCIIFDPPRKGLESSIIDIVNKSDIKKIVYLSCNPTTHLRDIKLFIERQYKIKKLMAFDMFPHTYHIESLAVLEKT